jgi:hypothetical protein
MAQDVYGLVRLDHDDLDRALRAMSDAATAVDELAGLLDVFRLALAVHVAAEARVLQSLLDGGHAAPVLRAMVTQIYLEHRWQQQRATALSGIAPGSEDWYDGALELRILVLDHAAREDHLRWQLQAELGRRLLLTLAAEYATERMRVLSTTSPLAVAARLS